MKLSNFKVTNPYSGDKFKPTNIMGLLSLVAGAAVMGLAFNYGGRLAGKAQGMIDGYTGKGAGQVEKGPRKAVGI